MQAFHSNDGNQVGGNAADVGPHGVEQVAELLYIRFAGGVVDGGCSLSHHGSHDDVGSSRYRGLVEQHVAATQVLRLDMVNVALFFIYELCPQVLETQKVGVESAASNLVAPGFGNGCPAEAPEQGTDEQHTSAQGCTLANKLCAVEKVEVEVIGLEGEIVAVVARYPHPHVAKELNEVLHVENVGNVIDVYLFVGEQHTADHLQCFVFGTLRTDGALQQVTAFNDE